eukprot:scaffold332750_cov51-Attheya_sp.AAC.2
MPCQPKGPCHRQAEVLGRSDFSMRRTSAVLCLVLSHALLLCQTDGVDAYMTTVTHNRNHGSFAFRKPSIMSSKHFIGFFRSEGSVRNAQSDGGADIGHDDKPENSNESVQTMSQQGLLDSHEDIMSMTDAAAKVMGERSSLLGVKSVGVDYGLVRTGLAVTNGYSPRPHMIVSDRNSTEVAADVVRLVASERASRVILGLPLHKNGTVAEQTNKTLDFATYLVCAIESRFGPDCVPVYFWDERYTSKAAAARAHSIDPGRNLFKDLDAEAACLILEHYYQVNGEGAERVKVPDNMRETCDVAWTQQKEESHRAHQLIQQNRHSRLNSRQEAMERAKALEAQMIQNGTLGTTGKKKKKKKKKQSTPKTWITL